MNAEATRFAIEARSYGIAGFASHNFWALTDPEGNVIEELHGFATTPSNNMRTPLGFIGDELRFYRDILESPEMEYDHRDSFTAVSGPYAQILQIWTRAVHIIPYLNSRHFPYSPVGVISYPVWNSNSAYKIFGQAMGIPIHNFPWRWEPGIDNNLVEPEKIELLSQWYNLPLRFLPTDSIRTTLEGSGDLAALEKYLNLAKNALIDRLNREYPELHLQTSQFRSIDIFVDPEFLTNQASTIDSTIRSTVQDALIVGEGGANILLSGGGNDVLIGGGGQDTLEGGKGIDTLVGGQGFDTYIINSGDGNDRIIDSDGLGRLIINGKTMPLMPSNFRETSPGSGEWISPDGTLRVTHHSPWQLILPSGMTIELGDGFQSGHLGINLLPALGEPQTHVMGDLQPRLQTTGSNRGKWATDLTLTGASNLATTGQPAPGFSDALLGGARHDWLQGLAGNDVLAGAEGDDRLDGGEGNDLLTGGDGADTLEGGDGNDYLIGGWSYNGGQPSSTTVVRRPKRLTRRC